MREIKFRGKVITSREKLDFWIFGNLIIRKNEPMCILQIGKEDEGYIAVHKESIGEFTGLKDKNGKEIFEGDIVEIKGKVHIKTKGVIEFGKCNVEDTGGSGYGGGTGFGFYVKYSLLRDKVKIICKEILENYEFTESKFIKVIGNIYENSELLEGKK